MKKFLKVTFIRSIVGREYIAILGAQKVIWLRYEGRKLKGTYKVLQTVPDMTSSLKIY